METKIKKIDCESWIFRLLADKKMTIPHLFNPYAFSITTHRESTDISRINKAIIERWSMSALDRIKTAAWAILKANDELHRFYAKAEEESQREGKR